MSNATEAVDFLIKDHGDKNPPGGFRQDFAEDAPYRSILRRLMTSSSEETPPEAVICRFRFPESSR